MSGPTIKNVKLSALVLDFSIYPRAKVDPQHSSYIAEAMRAGRYVLPIIVEEKSLRIIDGFHRFRAHRIIADPGADPEVPVEVRNYDTEADLLRDAIKLNSTHGKALTTWDRKHAINLAENCGITDETIAEDLAITLERVILLRGGMARKHASTSPPAVGDTSGPRIPLKRMLYHMAGRELSQAQVDAQEHLLGVNQTALVSQLLLLIRNDLVDTDNPRMIDSLRELRDLLNGLDILDAEAA